jgi:hypothetical protein
MLEIAGLHAWKIRPPNTLRIGCAKLLAEYCVSGLRSGKPQSHGSERRVARTAKRWIAIIAIATEIEMNSSTSRPL